MKQTLTRLREMHDGNGLIWMWTLTTAQGGKYDSPQQAHEDVTQNERIRKLCSKMGWKYWTWVLEWHKKDGGWPHWHVLVYTPTRAPIWKRDVEEAWKPGFTQYERSDKYKGGLKSQIIRTANYVTKYLTKPGESPVPDWILDSKKVVRMCSSSRAWSAIENTPPHVDESTRLRETADPQSCPENRKTHREAIDECGEQAVLLREYVNPLTGEIAHEYLGTVNLPYRSIRRWIERRFDQAKSKIQRRHARIKDKSQDARILRRFLDPHMI